MKKIQLILLCLFIALISILTACSDDFLKKNAWSPDLTLEAMAEPPMPQAGTQKLVLELPKAGNSSYSIVKYPGWMTPESFHGVTSNDVLSLTYAYDGSSFHILSNTDFTFAFEIASLGLVEVQVSFQQKLYTKLEVQPERLDFGMESTRQKLRLINNGNQEINIRIESVPDWINPESSPEFLLWMGGSIDLSFTCDRSKAPSGTQTGYIVLKCNEETLSVPVSIQVEERINKDLFAIEGVVNSAVFDKVAGIMYIATQGPNQIIVYNAGDESKQYIALPKAPKSIKLSENGTKLFIGHSGLISIVNTATRQITSSIEVDFNIFDLVYGENDWCYSSIDETYSTGLYGINIKTKEVKRLTDYSSRFDNHTYLTKVKGKALIIGSREQTSPAGVLLADITNPAVPVEKYWHEDYGRLWLSEDQKYTYSATGRVFKTPDINTKDLFILNTMRVGEGYANFNWIEPSEALNSLFAINVYSMADKSNAILRYETTDYTISGIRLPDKSFATVNGVIGFYPTITHYVFIDKESKNLFLIKNILVERVSQEHNSWSVQKITTDKE